jgi:hypothetical protein
VRVRNGAAALLTLLSSALILGSVLAGWIHHEVLDTEGYTRNIRASADDPVVVAAATEVMASDLTTNLLNDLASQPLSVNPDGTPIPTPTPEELGVREAALRAAASPVFTDQWATGWLAARPLWFVSPDTVSASGPSSRIIVVNLEPVEAIARDQIAANGWPSFGGAPLTSNGLVITAQIDPLDELSGLPDARWRILGVGIVLLALAYLFSTRRRRLTLLLGAELLVGGLALWLLTPILQQQVARAGAALIDQELLRAAFGPFGRALAVDAWVTAGIGLFLVLVALTALSFRTDEERHVRSRHSRGAQQAEVR